MTYDSTIASIDIWSSKIKTVIWKFNEKNDFQIMWIWIISSNAMRKWNILDMEEFKSALDKSLEEAEKMAWEQIDWAYISFNSSSIEVIDNKWIIAVSGEEITYDDIDRALDMSKNGIELLNKEVLKVIPDNFTVDLETGIKSPIWMSARKLEVKANIFTIGINVFNNIKKAISDIWIEIIDVYPNLISAPEWVLTKRQKELGVVCIDIWSSTTGITVYEEGTMKFSKVIPLGGDNVTNDVALWLRTSIDTAEELKIKHGIIWLQEEENKKSEEIHLATINQTETGSIDKILLSKIITARYEEILFFIRDDLRRIWKDGMLPEWAVIVWGWAKMKWLVDLAKDTLRLPTIIWIPAKDEYISGTSISDPLFSSVIGTMILANKYSAEWSGISLNFKSFFSSLKKLFAKMTP